MFEICTNTHFAKPFYLLAYSNMLEDGELLLLYTLSCRKLWKVALIRKCVRERGKLYNEDFHNRFSNLVAKVVHRIRIMNES